MSKQVKTVSMLLALSALSVGTVNAGTITSPNAVQNVQTDAECKGVVIDATGEPMIGASVVVKGKTGLGTVTDIDGNFALDLESNKAELEFSYIGMVTKKLKASEKMQVVLDPDTHVLEQVIITGYGAAKKLGSVVGAISNIGEKKLETVVTPNFTDALAGQVSG